MIGGSCGVSDKGCDDWSKPLEGVVSEDNLKMMKSQSSFLLRNVWRYDLCTAPTADQCHSDSSSDSCQLQCAGCENDEFTEEQLSDLTQWFTSDVIGSVSTSQLQTIAKTIFCDSKTIVGEHVEASSPADHSFWVMHGTLERLLQYKQLVKPFGDYTWDASSFQSDWTSECKWGATFKTDCAGHADVDLAAGKMSILDEETGLFVSKYLSNHHIVQLSMKDNTKSLPYVYDTFDYSHCEGEGIEFKKVPKM